MSDALDRLVRDSRPELGVREAQGVDWSEVDRRVFERVAAERAREQAGLSSGRGRGVAFVLGGLAAAAAAALFVAKGTSPRVVDAPQASVEEAAGSVTAVEGGGALIVDGKPAAVGATLHQADVIDATGGRVTVDRPGKLTFVLEKGSIARVTHVQGALVLALEQGAVEAQVVPVPNGEAFAVDVGTSRVAVHGTHLRVARDGSHVVVDLSEGVVSLGDAPRVGSTFGSLITAPAHAEFSAGEPEGSLSLSHDPSAVRPPVSLAGATASLSHASAAPVAVAVEPARSDTPEGRARAVLVPPPARPANAAPAVHPTADPNPAATIGWAVRSCFAERPRGDNVTVVVSTTLRLELSPDGAVQSARFDPPVAPDVNACAAASIYRVRFAHGGSEAIPVDLTLPASAP